VKMKKRKKSIFGKGNTKSEGHFDVHSRGGWVATVGSLRLGRYALT